MPYVDGFVLAVASADREAYRQHGSQMAAIMKRHGVLRYVETWGDDVPQGKLTSFPLAVQLKDGETVVFAWAWWPDKATRDAAWPALEADPELTAVAMPFDGKRMIFGGFEAIVDA